MDSNWRRRRLAQTSSGVGGSSALKHQVVIVGRAELAQLVGFAELVEAVAAGAPF